MSAPQIKAAKDALEQAITAYNYRKSIISKSLNSGDPPNERTLRNKMSHLDDALKDLNATHTSWVKKADFSDENLQNEHYSLEWLENEWSVVGDIQDKVDIKLTVPEPPEQQGTDDVLFICEKQMESLQLDITTKLENLDKNIPSSTAASVTVYTNMLTDVKNHLEKDFVNLSKQIMSLDVPNVRKNCTTFEQFKQEQQKKICSIEIQLAEKVHTPVASSTTNRLRIEMEKSKTPSFSGKTIDYPEFKRGWLKVPGVMWEDANQVEQIKFKVDAHSRMLISRCNTMSEVWEVLDTEFAQEQEVINAVNEELMRLRSTDCSTPQYIVNLRNYLPTLEENLRSVDGIDHLCSPDRVHFLAAKFDERTMYDWEYFKSKNSGSTYARFFNFLLDRYESSRSILARLKSESISVATNSMTVNLTSSAATAAECRRCQTFTARNTIYTCPGCGRGTLVGENILHCLEHCGAYMRMNPNERSACVEAAGWCPVHLASHTVAQCNMNNESRYICGIDNCQNHHHKSLHGSTTPFVINVHATELSDAPFGVGEVLLGIQNIPTTSGHVNTLFDNCSSCSLITRNAARRLNLVGEQSNFVLKTVNGDKVIQSHAYHLTLVDNVKTQHTITVYEVDNISDNISKVSLSGVKHLFSKDVQRLWKQIDKRPSGEIDLLIGENVCGLHPTDWVIAGNLKIKKSIFGSGYLLTGSHPAIASRQIKWNENVLYIRNCSSKSQFYVNRISIKPMQEYFARDALGVAPPRRCGNCLNCSECGFRGQKLSQEEQYQYHELESRVKYNPASRCFHVSYPFTEDPAILRDNKSQVIKIAERLENKLMKSGNLDAFNQEFSNMLKYTLIELPQEELDMWDGPKHYISLQHVINEDSATTPLRIVGNSSLSDKRGVSLNSITMKGPNTLSDQWNILTKWRSREVGMITDITKAYHSLRTGQIEKHLRRVVWRYGDQSAPWKVFGFRTVSFGDRPAAALLEIALKKTANDHGHIDPEAADRILRDRYVDDIASGGTPSQVARFIGNEIGEFQCDGTIPTILSQGSFKLKVMVPSGETDSEKLAKLGTKVLGLGYEASTDKVYVDLSVSINIGRKNNEKVAISPETPLCIRNCLTKSNILGIINGIYDPIGLTTPITIKLRIYFRNLFRSDSTIDWNDPIPPEDQDTWMRLIRMLAESSRPTFSRATTPANAVGKPQLVCYFDGSDNAYAAVIYIRWVLSDDTVKVLLLGSKAHVTPLNRISTPRSELNGAVLASRLTLSTVKTLSETNHTPERVWLIGDSECILASLEKVNSAFGEYFGYRIGEIVDCQAQIEKFCAVGNNGEWWHTESEHNSADVATRLDSKIEDISEGTEWQDGKSHIKLDPSQWNINRDFAERKDDHIPKCELLKRYRNLIHKTQVESEVGIQIFIDIKTTNVWETLIRKTRWIITWPMLMPFFNENHGGSSPSNCTHYAKTLWFRSAMQETREAKKNGRLKELNVRERDDGLLVIEGRAQIGLHNLYGTSTLPVIMADTKVAELVMVSAHWKDHTGEDITMAMSRMEAWIVNGKKLAKRVVKKCVRCRYLRKKLEGQKMAVLPDLMQVPSRPFTNVGVDLCGPISVKSMTNKRATMKVWIAIFVCLNTKAVGMELAPGYSTDDFMLAYDTHISCRGTPSYVYSDKGSQLVAAQKEISDDPLRYDWDSIASKALRQGTKWEFAPAGGQWRNGATESFVKKFKRSFYHLYNNTRLNYAELLCAVKRIANILNNRPISVQRTKTDTQDEDFLHPLTPNMLLLMGDSGNNPPSSVTTDEEDPRVRLSFIDEIECAWWYQYKIQYFHSLMPTRKWTDEQRNMCPGDVVLIEYKSKSLPGTYRLGRVKDVEVDERDNLVRTCTVIYKLIKPITNKNKDTINDVVTKEIRVPVQRLVLILPVEEQ